MFENFNGYFYLKIVCFICIRAPFHLIKITLQKKNRKTLLIFQFLEICHLFAIVKLFIDILTYIFDFENYLIVEYVNASLLVNINLHQEQGLSICQFL